MDATGDKDVWSKRWVRIEHVQEAAFRGYMQGTIERRHGLPVAILVTGTMLAVAHLDFTMILWPYYLAVAAVQVLALAPAGTEEPSMRPWKPPPTIEEIRRLQAIAHRGSLEDVSPSSGKPSPIFPSTARLNRRRPRSSRHLV